MDILQLLSGWGADPNVGHMMGRTALMSADRTSDSEASSPLHFLVGEGVEIASTLADGARTTVHIV